MTNEEKLKQIEAAEFARDYIQTEVTLRPWIVAQPASGAVCLFENEPYLYRAGYNLYEWVCEHDELNINLFNCYKPIPPHYTDLRYLADVIGLQRAAKGYKGVSKKEPKQIEIKIQITIKK